MTEFSETLSLPKQRSGLPTVSVVTVVRNAEDVIKKTIESVLQQSYPAVEYVVVDGRSTDSTWSTIQKFEDRIDMAISEPDEGIYDAMNKAARLASGEWIIFMNAGDTFADAEVLSRFTEAFAGDADVILGGVEQVLVDDIGERRFTQMPGLPDDLWIQMPTSHQSVFVRRTHLLTHPFDTSYRWCADQHQLLRLYAAGKKFRRKDSIVSVFDCHSDQVRSTNQYIHERWALSRGHASLPQRVQQFGYEWLHNNAWGPLVSFVKSVMPNPWVRSLRRMRGTDGDTTRAVRQS